MPKQEGQKSKLLTLLRILEQKTDEEHLLNVPQLVQLLEQQGILAERKSIYSDIDTLRSLGFDVQLQRGRGGGYWLASRTFELSELKLLVDAVQASKVISARTSRKLIHKLEALCSDYEGSQLQRQVYVDGRPKSDSHTLLYSIDALHSAINAGRMVSFRYKKDGTRTVSPWRLAWDGGCYYLIAYQDEKEPAGIRNYRVDRMSAVTVLDEARRAKPSSASSTCPPTCASTSICSAAPNTGSPCAARLTLKAPCATVLAKHRSLFRKKTAPTSTLMCRCASAPSSTAGCAALTARWK